MNDKITINGIEYVPANHACQLPNGNRAVVHRAKPYLDVTI